jgi:hypothetical protein
MYRTVKISNKDACKQGKQRVLKKNINPPVQHVRQILFQVYRFNDLERFYSREPFPFRYGGRVEFPSQHYIDAVVYQAFLRTSPGLSSPGL